MNNKILIGSILTYFIINLILTLTVLRGMITTPAVTLLCSIVAIGFFVVEIVIAVLLLLIDSDTGRAKAFALSAMVIGLLGISSCLYTIHN